MNVDKLTRRLDSEARKELGEEMERHHQEVTQIAVLPDSHWVLQLISEDERHYTRLLRMLKAFRATAGAHPRGDGNDAGNVQ